MRHIRTALALVVAVLALAACTNDSPPINRIGTNVVDKSVFTGSWYFSRVVIDVDYEASSLGTFPGDAANDFAAAFTLPRVRWVIDEDTLYAFRDYEIIEGGQGEPQDAGAVLGHPVAAFTIESHFDIRRAYNTITGEEQNVVEENDVDRRWFDRDYMRVDWSQNRLPGYYGQTHDLYAVLGFWTRESSSFLIQPNSEFPENWKPQFNYMTCNGSDDTSADCLPEDRDLADEYAQGELYHMSFVTQEIMSPGTVFDPFQGPVNFCLSVFSDSPQCASVAIFIRNSFLRVSDTREYERVNFVDTRFERHGYFRLERPTFDRSTGPGDPAFGATDFLNYGANRQNLWKKWVGADGEPLPYAEREVRPVVWYTTPELPGHLVQPAYRVVGEWNGVLTGVVRRLQGQPEPVYPDVQCQTEDPDAYCFCRFDDDGDLLNATCAGRYDPFESPAAAEARGVTAPIDCFVEGAAEAEPDMTDAALAASLKDSDFWGWFDTRMVGSECHTQLRLNTCNRASLAEPRAEGEPALRCQERGDLRFKFFSYVDQPGTPFLGIATLRGDPVSGEIVTGDANIGGPALDTYRTFALQTYDLERGNIEDEPFLAGEDVRRHLERLNRAAPPAQPRPSAHVTVLQATSPNNAVSRVIDNVMSSRRADANGRLLPSVAERIEQLKGREAPGNLFTYGQNFLENAPDEERRLFANDEAFLMAGFDDLPTSITPASIGEDFLGEYSPFRVSINERLRDGFELDQEVSRRAIHLPNAFTDSAVTRYASDRASWPRARLEFGLNRYLMFATQLHEMGHCFGLRHSFASSADVANYHDDYYRIAAAYPLPRVEDYDTNGNGLIDTIAERTSFDGDYEEARRLRKLAGIDTLTNASIMEYMPDWYGDTPRHGRYDEAAIAFGYGDTVEVIDNARGLPVRPLADGDDRLDTLENPLNGTRVWAKYYVGGESCEADADCPFSSGGARAAELLDGNRDAGLTQRCVAHPNPTVAGARLCSNFDDDAAALVGDDLTPEYAPVTYQFCTDDRASGFGLGTLGICHRFDDGDSYREIVRNLRDRHERQYLWENFRRYRRGYDVGSAIGGMNRRFQIMQSIYQNMLFRYSEDPAFRQSTGPFGFYDQFLASVDILNFYGERVSAPGIGSYTYSPTVQQFFWQGSNLDAGQFNLRLEDGARFFNSDYQDGLTGIRRVERVGSYYERIVTLQLLTQRGAATRYTRDVPFLLNFYDVFPVEVTQMIGGILLEKPEMYSPRLVCESGSGANCRNPTVLYPDFYRGDCLSADAEGCRPPYYETELGELDTLWLRNTVVKSYATLFSLIFFPTYFDTTYRNQLAVCVEGYGTCQKPAPGLVEGVDYVRFPSKRFLANLLAFRTTTPGVGSEGSIGFELVKELSEVDFLWRTLEVYRGDFDPSEEPSIDHLSTEQRARLAQIGYTLPPESDLAAISNEITRLRDRAEDFELFVNNLVFYQVELGILSIF